MSDTPRTDRAKWTIKDHYSGSGQSEVVCASVAETLETENATLHAANDKLLNEGIELLHDKTAEIETLRARIEELEEDIEAYRESQRQRAHGSEEAFIRKLNARIAELEAAVETAACRFEDPKFHCCWQDAADDLRRVVVR